jgi:hypothetical protein
MPRFNHQGSALFIAGFAALCAAVACGNSDDGGNEAPKGGAPSAAGSNNTAGKVTGGSGGGGASQGGSAGSSATAGKPSTAGSAGQASAGSGNGEGGSGGGAGEGTGGTPSEAGAGGGDKDDPRPGCAKVPGIALSNLHLVEGAGPGDTAQLEIDVTNGSGDFVSYNPVKITCTGDAVESASDQISVFGITEGGMNTVTLDVTFEDSAQTGDIASCTVRGFIYGTSPEDCQNAQTMQLDVTVE